MTDEPKDQMELLPLEMPIGKVKKVKLDALPEDQPGPEPTFELIASVMKFGVVLPIVVIERLPGKFEVVDGRRRIKAARKLEMKDIPARVYQDDGLLFAGEVLAISLNRLRSRNPAAEYEAIKRLIEEGASLDEIRKATGLPRATIWKRMQLEDLNKKLLDGLVEGKIATSVAEEAAKLPKPAQKRLAKKFEKDEKVTMRDVKGEKSARAMDEMEQIPADVFKVPDVPWQKQVADRLEETLKLIPSEGEDLADALRDWVKVLREK